jgi:hypothetical protein
MSLARIASRRRLGKYAAALMAVALSAGAMLAATSAAQASPAPVRPSAVPDPASVPLRPSTGATGWSIESTPNPQAPTGTLQAVSCTSVSACTAVGSSDTNDGASVTLAERWNGTAWTIQPTPNPSGSTASSLLGGSCTSATSCTAIGDSSTSAGAVTLAERWNGTAWTVQTTPNPGSAEGTYSTLEGVSCTSATACTAVGSSNPIATGLTATLAERWNGTAWSIQATPNPSGAETSELNEVSCPSDSACAAAGQYSTAGLFFVTLAERFS